MIEKYNYTSNTHNHSLGWKLETPTKKTSLTSQYNKIGIISLASKYREDMYFSSTRTKYFRSDPGDYHTQRRMKKNVLFTYRLYISVKSKDLSRL